MLKRIIALVGSLAIAGGIGLASAGSASAAAQDYGCTFNGVLITRSASYGSANLHRMTGGTIKSPPAVAGYSQKGCTSTVISPNYKVAVYSLTAAPGRTIQAWAYSSRAGMVRMSELNEGVSIQSSTSTSSQGVTRAGVLQTFQSIRIYNVTGGVLGSYFTLCDGTDDRLAEVPSCVL